MRLIICASESDIIIDLVLIHNKVKKVKAFSF